MTKRNIMGWVFFVLSASMLSGCDNAQDAQLPSAVQIPQVQVPQMQVPQVPVPQVAQPTPPVVEPAAPPPPPQTELYPIIEETPEKTTGSGGGGGTGVCKLPGPASNGDEILGNYQCNLDTKDMPFGLKPPAFGCRVSKAGDDKLILAPQGQRGGMSITEMKLAGFKLDGAYTFSGQKLQINTCMRAKGVGKYVGSGSGVLNGDKKNKVKYTLTMTRQ